MDEFLVEPKLFGYLNPLRPPPDNSEKIGPTPPPEPRTLDGRTLIRYGPLELALQDGLLPLDVDIISVVYTGYTSSRMLEKSLFSRAPEEAVGYFMEEEELCPGYPDSISPRKESGLPDGWFLRAPVTYLISGTPREDHEGTDALSNQEQSEP